MRKQPPAVISFLKFISLAISGFPAMTWAQAPVNYISVPKIKAYSKFQNPLIKRGQTLHVSIVNGQAYLEGDIDLGSEASLDEFQGRMSTFSVTQDDNWLESTRWTNGIVPFVILDGFSENERAVIISAMNHIAANSNVCFRRRTDESGYIKFKKYSRTQLGFDGGSSRLGRCGYCLDGQEIKLSSVTNAVVRHEICHALGLLHEQSREDRNNFVEILKNNIQEGQEYNFDQAIYSSTDVGNYDFASIMHYFSTAFGKKINGVVQQTIKRKSNPSDQSFGFSEVLSNGDKQGINSMYPQSQTCATLHVLAPGELEVGESKTVTISANKTHDLTGVYLRNGQKFQFSTASPAWQNNGRNTDCDGYEGGPLDVLRRHNDLKMMALVGEIFEQNNTNNFTGTYFRIGCGRTWTATKTGYLVCFANDIIAAYNDNTGVVTLTIKRTE